MKSALNTVAVIEDHPLVAKITREVVLACAPDVNVLLFASLKDLEMASVNVSAVLTDLALPDGEGMAVIGKVKDLCPDVPILVCTATDSKAILNALDQQGLSWVHKRAPSEELFAKVVCWLQSAGLVGKASDVLAKLSKRNAHQSEIIAPRGDKPLTIKQVQIMECSAKGLSAKETARVLGLSLDTVRAHMTDIFYRLGARNVAQAVDIFNRAKRDASLRSTDSNH